MRACAAFALASGSVNRLTARSVIQYRTSPNAIWALFACSIVFSNSAASTIPAELLASFRVR